MNQNKSLLDYFAKNSVPVDLEFRIGELKFIQKGTLKLERENQFLFTNNGRDNLVSFNLSNILSIEKDRPQINLRG